MIIKYVATTFLISMLMLGIGSTMDNYNLLVDGEVITFTPGSEYCALDERASEFDRFMVEFQRDANTGINDVIAIFVDCSLLESLRTSAATEVGRYGILLATHIEGELKKIHGISRASLLDLLADANEPDIDTKSVNDRINNAIESDLGGNFVASGIIQLGELARDRSSIYKGLLMHGEYSGESKVMSGVSAQTLINGYIMQYSLYEEYTDQSTIDSLLHEIQPVMIDMVTNNDASGASIPRSLDSIFDWKRILQSALVGGLAGASIAVIFIPLSWLRKRWKQRK